MKFDLVPLLLVLVALPHSSSAQQFSVHDWLDIFVAACVGSGNKQTADGVLASDGEMLLQKLTTDGRVVGEVSIHREEASLLIDGISSKLTELQASQADSVRECLAPVRSILGDFMKNDLNPGNVNSMRYLLSPEEDKVMLALANIQGYFGQVGEAVPVSEIQKYSGYGDIRLRAIFARLRDKWYIFDSGNLGTGQTKSLMPDGDEYVLRRGFAN